MNADPKMAAAKVGFLLTYVRFRKFRHQYFINVFFVLLSSEKYGWGELKNIIGNKFQGTVHTLIKKNPLRRPPFLCQHIVLKGHWNDV